MRTGGSRRNLVCVFSPMQAAAQQWPDKPVRILVPFPPGGGTDIQARLLSIAFQKSMGQNFIVDNRTGAGGLIAGQLAVDSPPDGNTILFTSGQHLGDRDALCEADEIQRAAPTSHRSAGSRRRRWCCPCTRAFRRSRSRSSWRWRRVKPGVMNAGGNTAGSTAHLTGEMLNQVAGIKTTRAHLSRRRAGGNRIDLGRDRLHLRHGALRSCRT